MKGIFERYARATDISSSGLELSDVAFQLDQLISFFDIKKAFSGGASMLN